LESKHEGTKNNKWSSFNFWSNSKDSVAWNDLWKLYTILFFLHLYEEHKRLLRATLNKQSGRQFGMPALRSRCQFHPHFMSTFYVKSFVQLFSNYSLPLWLFGQRILVKKFGFFNFIFSYLSSGYVLWIEVGSSNLPALSSRNLSTSFRCQFHQHFRCSFYARRSQKCKKDWQLDCLFYASGICVHKSCKYNVDEIVPRCQNF